MFCIILKYHSWEPEVKVILSVIVSFNILCIHRCGHRGNYLRPQCRYTIRYDIPDGSSRYQLHLCIRIFTNFAIVNTAFHKSMSSFHSHKQIPFLVF